MLNAKKLMKMARKWQQRAVLRRKRIASARSSAVERGCFVVYTSDKRRFALPITYLTESIFQELLKMSEDEFGLPGNGPITLPCDSAFLNYLVSLVRRRLDKDTEKALLISMPSDRCSSQCSSRQEQSTLQLLVC
ncbi:PREDICTED: auxin-responsive protein SAUR67-like [Tarenaya hassleriana]|uniref:auxin-responsive protein SAUR67-like n=1 Tax=Tarenaya hassleriana TaxID=28532 RepID=UPI00053C7109|nr:PREDICTED: auxin-responsive protein SAUR67-like [Tarenaya hassleriana]